MEEPHPLIHRFPAKTWGKGNVTATIITVYCFLFTGPRECTFLLNIIIKIRFFKFMTETEPSTRFGKSFSAVQKWKMGRHRMKATNIFIYVGLCGGLESQLEWTRCEAEQLSLPHPGERTCSWMCREERKRGGEWRRVHVGQRGFFWQAEGAALAASRG